MRVSLLKKSVIQFMGVGFMALAIIALSSCASLLDQLRGVDRQDTVYFTPNFFNEKIIAARHTLGPELDPGSGRYPYDYIVLIDPNSNEESLVTDKLSSFSSNSIQIEPSKFLANILFLTPRYEATSEITHPIMFHSVYLYLKNGHVESYFDIKDQKSKPTSIKYSPDETRLAVSFGNEKFIVTNLQGEGTREYTQGGNFIWKDNSNGYFYKKDVSRLALINLNNEDITTYPVDIVPMTYNASAEEIYSLSGNTFEAYKLGSTEVTRKTLNFDPGKYIRPHISSDGKKVVMCTTPYLLPDGTSYEAGGIYLIDVDKNVLKEIRYYRTDKIIPE